MREVLPEVGHDDGNGTMVIIGVDGERVGDGGTLVGDDVRGDETVESCFHLWG